MVLSWLIYFVLRYNLSICWLCINMSKRQWDSIGSTGNEFYRMFVVRLSLVTSLSIRVTGYNSYQPHKPDHVFCLWGCGNQEGGVSETSIPWASGVMLSRCWLNYNFFIFYKQTDLLLPMFHNVTSCLRERQLLYQQADQLIRESWKSDYNFTSLVCTGAPLLHV